MKPHKSLKQSRYVLNKAQNLLLLAGSICLISGTAYAQDSGYKVGEKPTTAQTGAAPATADKPATGDKQPVAETKRLARIDYVSGNVTWRADDNAAWAKAKSNVSLREGAQIWATDGGRAEIRFDDGSLLRIGNGAVVTLQTLFGDAQGEFTQIKMAAGVATLRPKQERSVYQVDTPSHTVKMSGPARVRIGVGDEVEIGVRLGQATVEGKQGKTVVHAGNYLAVHDGSAPYDIHILPAEDSWERWNDERDHILDKGYPVYPVTRPVYAPAPSVWFNLAFPIGPVYPHYWFGRGAYWHR